MIVDCFLRDPNFLGKNKPYQIIYRDVCSACSSEKVVLYLIYISVNFEPLEGMFYFAYLLLEKGH